MSHVRQGADIELARTFLVRNAHLKVVAVKDGQVIGHAEGKGVRPILELAQRLGELLQGASVADRVIGRAAGFVLIASQVAAAYGRILSREAEELLGLHGISVAGETLVPYIQGPDRSGRCLMEQQVQGLDDAAVAIRRLQRFLGVD